MSRASRRPAVRSRRRAVNLLLVVGVLIALVPTAAAAAPVPDRAPRRILVVSMPRVTWADVAGHRPRNLLHLLRGAAVASMSTRTVGPRTDNPDAYLTIGAGNRADSPVASLPGDAAERTEDTANGPAAQVYRRRTGIRPTGEVLVLSLAQQIARNEELLYGAEPGSLASALHGTGRVVGVVGNADTALEDAVPKRDVALAAMDRRGQVPVGNVSDSLLVADPLAPFGVRTDSDALVASVDRGWRSAAMQIVELSDLERAEEARIDSTETQGDREFAAALQRADAQLGRILDTVDLSRDVVMVVAPSAPVAAEELTVFGMAGRGVDPGWARSPTTRRAGFVTLTDIAPTILDRWGIDPPSSMSDTPIVSVPSPTPLSDRIDTMVRDDERALFRDDVTGPVTVGFIVALVLLLVAVMWVVGRSGRRRRRLLQVGALAVVAAPTVMYLSGLLPYGPLSIEAYAAILVAASLVLAGAASLLHRWDQVAPPVALCLLAIVVLVVDVVSGAHLQLNTPFGYSPIVAGRFAGYGNQAFSILTISALVVVTAGWEIWRRRAPGSGDLGRTLAAVAVFLVVIVCDGAPTWGSDVGGVISTIPAFAVCLLLLSGRRIRVRLVALIAVCTAGVLVLFAAIDLARPVDARTHLGRFAQKLLDGNGAIILQRKVEANVSILTSTIWTIVIPVALLFLAYLTWRPNRLLRHLNEEHLGFRPFGISALTLGIVAWAVNDSGVAIPALMLTVALPYTAYLVLGLRRGAPDAEVEPGPHPSADGVAEPVAGVVATGVGP